MEGVGGVGLRRGWRWENQEKLTCVPAADNEVIFIGVAIADDTRFEVVAGWWNQGGVGG